MTQGDLDCLRETCSFPIGVQTRIPGKGEMVLSASSDEVAFYEAAFPAGLRFPVHPTIRQILDFYSICPAQLSPNAWRNIISVLVIWRFHRPHLSLNEFRCLYTLLKGPGSESEWLYFKARPSKNVLKGAPSNVKGWKRRFFFISGDDWEFHPMIPREEGGVQVPRSWGAPVEVSSSGGGMAEGEVGGEAEGDIRGENAATADHTSESSRSIDVSPLGVLSREDSVELAGIIGEEMLSPHAFDLDVKAV
ncbi:Collagen alpha-1(VII) chain like [Actinidia chinensis var. chinensis]|uniref:Collagen alpha-1(VII) chain like n=1 Tax=Actinidia chinensis var. chinensis TaxID=1590841 RepID=A0A2R6S1K8_ACTCC|nr:Collagen alpha-1(VII) chain like [Actinidia chinensis var. chinensis]